MITAFSARITSNMAAPSIGSTIVFGTETLDQGDGYNPSTGIYTVQQNGTYTFTWSLTVYSGGYITTALTINNSPKQYLRTAFVTGDGSSSATVVVELNVGDTVKIKLDPYKNGNPRLLSSTENYSTFGGWMLK